MDLSAADPVNSSYFYGEYVYLQYPLALRIGHNKRARPGSLDLV